MSFFDWLQARRAATEEQSEVEAVRRIADGLDHLDPLRARYLAAFAYLLGRVAGADRRITEIETQAMERIVRELGGLTEAQAVVVVQIAKTETLLFGGTEDFRVAQEFRELASTEEKLALMRCLFAVSAADDSVDHAEDNEIRRISIELRVPHEEFVAARAAVRDKLAVLRPDPGQGPG